MNDLIVMSLDDNISGKRIRYININDIKYFMYSLNEIDEDGYLKIYVSRFLGDEELFITDFEWENLKTLIPIIVREIRENNIKMFVDLDTKNVEKVNVDNARVFKLKKKIVDSIIKEDQFDIIDNVIKNLLDEKNEQNETFDSSLEKLDDYLKNPTVDEQIMIPKNPYGDESLEYLKQENEMLNKKVKELEDKIETIKALLK